MEGYSELETIRKNKKTLVFHFGFIPNVAVFYEFFLLCNTAVCKG